MRVLNGQRCLSGETGLSRGWVQSPEEARGLLTLGGQSGRGWAKERAGAAGHQAPGEVCLRPSEGPLRRGGHGDRDALISGFSHLTLKRAAQ